MANKAITPICQLKENKNIILTILTKISRTILPAIWLITLCILVVSFQGNRF